MLDSNPLLLQLQDCKAFIVYRLVPRLDGKTDKLPTDVLSGRSDLDAQNPANWMLPAEAQMWADMYGASYGIGLVITEESGFFCLDLDSCREGDTWLPHAASFCARFPGAYVECSISGKGLHVIGRYKGERPDHGTRNKTYRMELYTKLRFIAVTGAMATGSVHTDCTHALNVLARDFFPPHDDTEYGDTLTTAPVAAWSGPADDDELIRRAMRSQSGASVFGGKAAFADLWLANADALARSFPPQTHGQWDGSAADLALANHLAFWTGNHGERMSRLMFRSGLIREKWTIRPGYLVGTINYACGSQKVWYTDAASHKAIPASPGASEAETEPHGVQGGGVHIQMTPTAMSVTLTVPSPPDLTPGAVVHATAAPSREGAGPTTPGARPEVGTHVTVSQQTVLFNGCIYVQDIHQVMMPGGYTLPPEKFDTEFSGYQFLVTIDGQRPAKRAWDAFVHSEVIAFPKVKGMVFDPRLPSHAIVQREDWTYVNSWVPIHIPRTRGDASPFIRHVLKILPMGSDAAILIAYLAACVQYPGYKFQWWPLIQGVEGNGKSLISVLTEMAIGQRYTHWPKSAELGSKFNNAFYGKLLVCVEDVYISEARGSFWEGLKPMITGVRLEIEGKGVDKVTREVCFNGILNTNHKNGIRKTRNDRRICPFYCAQQYESELARDGLDIDYFNWFRAWVYGEGGPIVADYLASYPIPEEWNPATTAIRPPKTSSTEAAITEGFGVAEQEVQEAISQNMPGFRGGWISSVALDRLLAVIGKAGAIPRNKRREVLEALGYSPHPGLVDGRSTVTDTDGSRPRLYVLPDAPGARETNPAAIMLWYQAAQRG